MAHRDETGVLQVSSLPLVESRTSTPLLLRRTQEILHHVTNQKINLIGSHTRARTGEGKTKTANQQQTDWSFSFSQDLYLSALQDNLSFLLLERLCSEDLGVVRNKAKEILSLPL